MRIDEQVRRLWGQKQQRQSADWAKALTDALPRIAAASAQFHRRKPFRIYSTVSKASGRHVEFSVRFRGQEVATLMTPDSGPQLHVSASMKRTNERDFGVRSPVGTFGWSGAEARAFRGAFDNALNNGAGAPHSPEHEIESRMLEHMQGAKGRFAGTLEGIQPVTLAGFPFQCPLPLSTSAGTPKATRGNMDILARHRGTLSLWELKRPGETAKAVPQVYAYAVSLARMLRGERGGDWFRLFGFNRALPETLTLEAVVAVTGDQQRKVEGQVAQLLAAGNPLALSEERARIKLMVAYYRPDSLALELKSLA